MSAADRNRQTVLVLALFGALAALAFGIAFYRATDWTAPFPHDATGLVAGRDFLNFWMAGRAALAPDPGQYYDLPAYNHALASVVGAGYPAQTWSYPPTQLLIAAPFGHLPYRLALLLWTGLGAAALYATLRRIIGGRAYYVFAAPAALFAVMSGQSSLFTTALLFAGLALLDKRPLLAGLLLGLLSLKPQLALVIPVALIAGRYWRSLGAAGVTAFGLIAATTALYGLEVWRDYLSVGVPAQNAVLVHTEILATQSMPTVFMNLHRAGLGCTASMVVQLVCALAAAIAVFWFWRRHEDRPVAIAATLAASVAATPYLMVYDTLPLAAAGAWLLEKYPLSEKGRLVIKLVWWLPFLQLALGRFAIPGAALIAPVMVLWLAQRRTPTIAANSG